MLQLLMSASLAAPNYTADEPPVLSAYGPMPFEIAQNFCLADVVFMGRVTSSKLYSVTLPNGHVDLFVDVKLVVELPYAGTSNNAVELVRLPVRHLHPLMTVKGKKFFVALDPAPVPNPKNFLPGQRFVSGLELFPDILHPVSNSALSQEAGNICNEVATRIGQGG